MIARRVIESEWYWKILCWFYPGWWIYLLKDCKNLKQFICRARMHRFGVVWIEAGDPLKVIEVRCIRCKEPIP